MKIRDLIMMSVRSLWRRKLRTALTILGVVIGACSIILMLSLGIAMNENFNAQMQDMGSLTVINVRANYSGDAKAPKLDDKALETFKAIEGVQKPIPLLTTNAYLEYGKYRTPWGVQIQGISVEDMEILGFKVEQGRLFTKDESNVIILGGGIANRQFAKKGKEDIDWENPLKIDFELETGKIKLDLANRDRNGMLQSGMNDMPVKAPKPYALNIVGISAESDNQMAYSAFVPVKIYEKIIKDKAKYEKKLWGEQDERYKDKNKYQEVLVKVATEEDVVSVQEAIKELGYEAYSPLEWLNEMKKASNSIQVMLGAIGAVSLVVAAIGITNTMMMSIYERTREIGVMKVIGAKLTDIKKMFLVEALLIGAIGGAVGVVFSYGLSLLVNKFGGQIAGSMMMGTGEKISVIPIWLAVAALVFSTLIGLGSGYFPARRAMKLSALSAIKTE